MHIIFGPIPLALAQKHLVLELDTFVSNDGSSYQTWCVVENLALTEFPMIESLTKIHQDLLQAYRDRNWTYCVDAIAGLLGKWNGELDTFYQDLAQRVQQYQQQDPGEHWDYRRPITKSLQDQVLP